MAFLHQRPEPDISVAPPSLPGFQDDRASEHRAAVEGGATGTSEYCALPPIPSARVEIFSPRATHAPDAAKVTSDSSAGATNRTKPDQDGLATVLARSLSYELLCRIFQKNRQICNLKSLPTLSSRNEFVEEKSCYPTRSPPRPPPTNHAIAAPAAQPRLRNPPEFSPLQSVPKPPSQTPPLHWHATCSTKSQIRSCFYFPTMPPVRRCRYRSRL